MTKAPIIISSQVGDVGSEDANNGDALMLSRPGVFISWADGDFRPIGGDPAIWNARSEFAADDTQVTSSITTSDNGSARVEMDVPSDEGASQTVALHETASDQNDDVAGDADGLVNFAAGDFDRTPTLFDEQTALTQPGVGSPSLATTSASAGSIALSSDLLSAGGAEGGAATANVSNFQAQNAGQTGTSAVDASSPANQLFSLSPAAATSAAAASGESGPSLTVNASDPSLVTFTVTGVPSSDHGTVTFTDANGASDVVSINANGTYSANLSNLANGTIDYTLAVTDSSGNTTVVDPSTSLGTVAGFTLDSNGWPVIPTQNGERIIYVSSSTGNDKNNGLTPQTAVATIAKGESLLQNGVGEELLLKSGDTFVNQSFGDLTVSGASASAPLVIGTYGTGPAPIVETSPNANFGIAIGDLPGQGGNNLVVEGINFYSYTRDPNNPAYAGPGTEDAVDFFNPNASVALIGDTFNFYTGVNFNYGSSATPAPNTNVTLYRDVITNAWDAVAHSQGLYVSGVSNLVIEQNIFDHNGWNASIPGAAATIFNRNVYLQYNNGSVTFVGNISADSASDGVQARTGGTITGNLFVNDSTGFQIGQLPGAEPIQPTVTSGIVSGNVVLQSNDIQTSSGLQPRSQGINIFTGSGPGVLVTDNIVADPTGATVNQTGIYIDNTSSGVGATNNIIYGFAKPVSDAGTGDTTSPNAINLSGYVNPNVSVESYNASLGGAATLAAFMAAADSQSMTNWNSAYTAAVVDAYIQAGFATMVTQVTATPTSGKEVAGNKITITMDFGQAVTVTGAPSLSLNDGGTATYAGGSGTSALTFSYTVGASDSAVPALAITAVNLPNGATIDDQGGNPSNLTNALVTFSGLQIGTFSGPVVSSIAESPSSGDLGVGKTVTLTLNMNEAVTVNKTGGTPTLTLNDGGVAIYTGGSGSSALTFSYTVGAGQSTSALAATSVNLNGATVTDGSGNAASFSLSGITQTGPQIDTTPLAVSSVTTSGTGVTNGNGDLNAGKTVTLTLNMSGAATVNTTGGTPTLTLNDGGVATYAGGSGTNALTFTYVVASGQSTSDLTVTAYNANGGTITNGVGTAATMTGAVTSPSGTLMIDTSAPTSPGSLAATAASSSQINLSWTASSDNVGVTGYDIFRNGTLVGTSTTNSYSDAGLPASTQYTYTVEAYDAAGNLSTASGGASATTLSVPGWSNVSLPTQTGTFTVSFDATPTQAGSDSVIGLSPAAAGAYADLAAIVRFNTSNTIDARNGSSYGANSSVSYTPGTSYHFIMVVNVATDTYSVYVTPQGGSQIALATNYAFRAEQGTDSSLANIADYSDIGSAPLANFTVGPAITSIVESPSSGNINAGKTVTLSLNMSEVVNVNTTGGTPTLTLNDGGTATYVSGSGSSALVFSYTAGAGQNTAALAATAINLHGAAVTDGAGNAANFSLTGLTQTGPQIDTTAPVISAIAETPSSGDLNVGKNVTFSLTMSGVVTVNTTGGAPTLTLNDGGTATYVSGSGSNALTFRYTVLAGQNTPDLMVAGVNLNGATIADGAGNAAGLSLTGIAQGSPQIDTTAPTLASVTANAGDYNANKTLTLTLNMSEAVNVTGTPTLTLNDGGTATYVSGSGSNVLTFSYTVGAGQNTSALAVTGISGQITDGAGNALSTPNLPKTTTGVIIDTTTPVISSIVESPSSGDLNTGKPVTVTVNLTEAVTVSGGTPTLALNNGGTATYTGGSGTNSLTFSYTVGFGQNTASLTATAVDLNGATIRDGAGNAANLSLTGLTQAGPQIDATAPALTIQLLNTADSSITANPAFTGTANANAVVTLSEGSTVVGTTMANASGDWSFTPTGLLPSGSQTITASESDLSGNISTASLTFALGTLIQTDTSAWGTTNLTLVGLHYFLYGPNGVGPEFLSPSGIPITTSSAWTPIGAVQTASGYDVAFEAAGNASMVCSTDSNGKDIANLTGTVSGASATLEQYESIFNQDLNGDGLIGTPTTVINAAGNLLLTLSTLTQSATIAAGASLELVGADTASVTFQGANGALILDHSSTFSGEVIGLTGNGNVASSDVIDLKDVAFGSARESYSGTATGGTLQVADALHDTANISLVGNYLNSTFSLYSDGNGGTLVVDPPVTQTPPAGSDTAKTVPVDGTVSNTTINGGSVQYDYGTANNTTINNGGCQIVEAGGAASDTTINTGGSELTYAGSTINGATINGGALELQTGAATEDSTIDFAGAGVLKLDGTEVYDMLVAGFASSNQTIDFATINSSSAKISFTEASNDASGMLSVTDGTHTASIALLGQYAATSFTSVSDGAGGIQISAVPTAQTQQTLLTHPTH
jgi:Bacterial Ig-like domain/Tryptophan-rich Synechocystis species C-terminal domain